MFATRYFCRRYFAPRYFPKLGAAAAVVVVVTPTVGQRRLLDVSLDYLVWDRSLNVGSDYGVWDVIEQVRYTSTRNAGDYADVIDTAKRRALTKKEQAASAGAYTGEDLVWLIPVVKLNSLLSPIGQQAKPGDAILDEDGINWTVLESQLIVFKSIWRLITRNLVIAYDLRDLIDIQEPTNTYPGGVKVQSWSVAYSQLPAKVQVEAADTVDERGIRGFRKRANVIVSRLLTLTEEHRILFEGETYDIVGYHNWDRLDLLMEIDAELRP